MNIAPIRYSIAFLCCLTWQMCTGLSLAVAEQPFKTAEASAIAEKAKTAHFGRKPPSIKGVLLKMESWSDSYPVPSIATSGREMEKGSLRLEEAVAVILNDKRGRYDQIITFCTSKREDIWSERQRFVLGSSKTWQGWDRLKEVKEPDARLQERYLLSRFIADILSFSWAQESFEGEGELLTERSALEENKTSSEPAYDILKIEKRGKRGWRTRLYINSANHRLSHVVVLGGNSLGKVLNIRFEGWSREGDKALIPSRVVVLVRAGEGRFSQTVSQFHILKEIIFLSDPDNTYFDGPNHTKPIPAWKDPTPYDKKYPYAFDLGMRAFKKKISKTEPEVSTIYVDLQSPHYQVRRDAVISLVSKKDPKAYEILIDRLTNDTSPNVRAAAAHSLGKLGEKRAVKILLQATSDKHSHVRGMSCKALGLLKSKDAVERLLECLRDEETLVQGTAITALGAIGDRRSVEALVPFLKHKWQPLAVAAIQSLGMIKDEKAIAPLANCLKHKDKNVRWQATHALGLIGRPKCIEPLIGALDDKYSQVRLKAVNALKAIVGKELRTSAQWKTWWQENKVKYE